MAVGKRGWFPFNGSVNSIIVYPFVLSQSQISQLSEGNIPNGYFAAFIAGSNWYKNGMWYSYNNMNLALESVNNPELIMV